MKKNNKIMGFVAVLLAAVMIAGAILSAQAAGTKLQIPIKAVALLLVLHGTQRCFCVFVHLRAFQPALQLLLAILRHLCLNASFVVLFRF